MAIRPQSSYSQSHKNIYNNKQISFEAENQKNRQWNNHELSESTKKKETWESVCID